MTQQINGQLGDWASKYAKAKPIEVSKSQQEDRMP